MLHPAIEAELLRTSDTDADFNLLNDMYPTSALASRIGIFSSLFIIGTIFGAVIPEGAGSHRLIEDVFRSFILSCISKLSVNI